MPVSHYLYLCYSLMRCNLLFHLLISLFLLCPLLSSSLHLCPLLPPLFSQPFPTPSFDRQIQHTKIMTMIKNQPHTPKHTPLPGATCTTPDTGDKHLTACQGTTDQSGAGLQKGHRGKSNADLRGTTESQLIVGSCHVSMPLPFLTECNNCF